MNGYQAGISDFTDTDSVVFGISTDTVEVNTNFATSLNLEFTILSDEDGAVAKSYGVLMDGRNMAKRATFVIDKDGKIAHFEEGMGAIDPAGAASACGKLN